MSGLSKSRYVMFRQCEKALWLKVYNPEVAVVDQNRQKRFEDGNSVGDLAMGLFGPYAKALFTRLIQQEKMSKSQIAVLKDPDYCKETFGIGSFAVLVDANTTYDKSRYYKHDSQIPFVICNNWHKQNWEKLQEWERKISAG